MSDENIDFEEITQNLNPIEKKKILLECGKLSISINKNIDEHAIKKKMPNDFMLKFNKSLKNLLSSGLLVRYRPHNYGLSKKGRDVSKFIKEKHQNELYSGLRILMLVD